MIRIITSKSDLDFVTLHRKALSDTSVNALIQWNKDFLSIDPTSTIFEQLDSLRKILGDITAEISRLSYLVRKSFRNFSPDLISEAQDLLPLVENFDILHVYAQDVLRHVKNTIDKIKIDFSELEQSDNDVVNRLDAKSKSVIYMLTSIANTNITERHKNFIRELAENRRESTLDKMEEYDEERQAMLQKKGMYSIANPEELTLKILREVLQNSGDAVFKAARNKNDTNYIPTIEIFTARYDIGQEKSMMDLIVRDNGVGMDLNTLREKFFVWFATGKDKDEAATGGLGIGKRLILETPEQGWSIATQGILSNRSLREFYLSRFKHESEKDLPAYFPKVESKGTTLALYSLPEVEESAIRSMCQKYALSSRLKIFVNGSQIESEFPLDQMKELDSTGKVLSETVGESEYQKKFIQDMVEERSNKFKNTFNMSHLGGLDFDHEGSHTSIRFYIVPKSYSGNVYYMINGLFQFEERRYITRSHIVCSINTNSRPGDSSYPMDQSRDKLRDPYRTKTDDVVSQIAELLSRIYESQVFKDGLDILTINKNMEPLNTGDSRDSQDNRIGGDSALKYMIGHSELFTQVENKDNIVEKIDDLMNSSELRPEQQTILQKTQLVIRDMEDKKINMEDLGQIIDGLSTPCLINIQKNFVSSKLAHNRVDLTNNLVILWKAIIEKIVNQTSIMSRSTKSYVPGLIYSDSALALYSPPNKIHSYHCISINPINVASLLFPDRFEKVIKGQNPKVFSEQDQLAADKTMNPGDTPTKKLTRFLYHEAIHEVTHLLFPDSYGDENFHIYISKMEYLCDPIYDDIRLLVKKFMNGVRNNSRDLITEMKKDRQATVQNKVNSSINKEKKIVLSRKQWEYIGKKSNWLI